MVKDSNMLNSQPLPCLYQDKDFDPMVKFLKLKAVET